jgi:tRNA pseudouridine55 synthase
VTGTVGARSSPPGTPGLLVVDKDAGMTSHDVVARCRRLLDERRVGHAGTLDPDATGVLLVGVGRATRLLRFLGAMGKSYVGEVVLGVATSTLDASGDVVGRWEMGDVDIDEVRAAAATLTGTIEQLPPMVSAVKVAGRRLHVLARQGLDVPRPARAVTVERFAVAPLPGSPDVVRIEVDCSSGTYVRVLAADLGALLGGGAHLRNLRRTRIGSFTLSDARRLPEIRPEHLLAPAQAVRDLPRLVVDGDVAGAVAHGRALDKTTLGASGGGPWAVVGADGRLLAVYEGAASNRMVAACVLEPAGAPGSDR